jgi:hypothetical protein
MPLDLFIYVRHHDDQFCDRVAFPVLGGRLVQVIQESAIESKVREILFCVPTIVDRFFPLLDS